MKNREALKAVIKKLVINEITRNDFGSRKQTLNVELANEWDKAVKSAAGKDAGCTPNDYNSCYLIEDGKGGLDFVVEVTSTDDHANQFDVRAVFHRSDRFYGKAMDKKDVTEFIKKQLTGEKDTYVNLAYKKSMQALGRDVDKSTKDYVKEKKEDAKDFDRRAEVEVETQKERADDNDKKAEEKADKTLAPTADDTKFLQMGGELVAKIEKIIDMALQKKVTLKADKDNESPDKLAVKLDGTSPIKGKNEKITPKVKDVDFKKSDKEKTKELKPQKK